jgi:hypothetical protein
VLLQTVYGLAALALAVPAAFHWRAPEEDQEEGAKWPATGLTWQAKVQLAAFCFFEVPQIIRLQSAQETIRCLNLWAHPAPSLDMAAMPASAVLQGR